MNTNVTLSDPHLFQQYLDKYQGEIRDKGSDNYYHIDFVAEAYNQGFEDGKKSSKKDFIEDLINKEIETFMQKANQIYLLSKSIIKLFNANSLHINITFNRCSAIIAVKDECLNDDDFINAIYGKIFEAKESYAKLYNDEYLDLGIVSSENLDMKILEQDGYTYKEIYG
jgi:hypothetical protein